MENKIKDRGWVKSAAIVFLTVMLILTFFSNTIMNYSLPQVSAQYTQYGTINSKVKGSGVVEAGDTYEVKSQSSREISGVAVKVGDTVEAGQTLFYLAGGDSTELEQARKAYNDANYAYQKALIELQNSGNNSAELLEIQQLESELEIAKVKRDTANKKYEDFVADIENEGGAGIYAQKIKEANALKVQLDATIDRYVAASENLADIQKRIDEAQIRAYEENSAYKAIEREYNTYLNQKDMAQKRSQTLTKRIQQLESDISKYQSSSSQSVSATPDQKQIDALKKDYLNQVSEINKIEAQIETIEKELPSYKMDVATKQEAVYSAKLPLSEAEAKKNSSQVVYDAAMDALSDAKQAYDSIKSNIPKSAEALAAQIKTDERALDAMLLDLKYLKQTINHDSSDDKIADLNTAYSEAYADYVVAKNALSMANKDPNIDEATKEHLRTEVAYAGERYRAALAAYEQALTDEDKKTNAYDKELAAKELQIRNAKEDLELLKSEYEEAVKSEVLLNDAQKIVDERTVISVEKRDALSKAKDEYNALNSTYSTYEAQLTAAQNKLDSKNAELTHANEYLELSRQSLEQKLLNYLDALNAKGDTPIAVDILNAELSANMATLSELNIIIDTATRKLDELTPALEAQKNNVDESNSMLELEKSYAEAENSYITSYEEKKDSYNALLSEIDTQRTTLADAAISARSAVVSLEKALNTAKHNLETNIANGKLHNLELSNQKRELDGLKEKLDIAIENNTDSEIKAKYAGVVSAVNVFTGEEIQPSQTLAVIQLVERGFKVSFSCTVQQASTLKVGEVAEIRNIWSYGTEAVLESIKNDPSNPGKSKLLTFKITGDVTPGQNLNLSVGSKNQSFEFVVPNTAIREDSKGKFILTVVTKQSPLGNRYIATRTDIEVLASDDTSTAISGALHGNEFVITSSSKPIIAGQQVKLVDEGN